MKLLKTISFALALAGGLAGSSAPSAAAFAQEPPKPTPAPSPAPAPAPAAEERILVPGTRVRLAPPPGHSPGSGFFGFTWPDSGSTLAVRELSGAYSDIVKSLNAEKLGERGMKFLSESDVKIDGRDAKLVYVSQKQRDIPVLKWLAATGDEKHTVLFTAVFAEPVAAKLAEPFKAAILGATWDPTLEVDPFLLLPWAVEVPKTLKFADNGLEGLVFTESGELESKDAPGQARLAISVTAGGAKDGDLKQLAESRARNLPLVGASLEIETSREFVQGLRHGWEIVGKARRETSAVDVVVHLIVLSSDKDTLQLTGIVAAAKRDEWLDPWRACAQSLMPKKKGEPLPK